MITLLATIVVLGVLIFVHELGHFATAKMVDIQVPRFSIGLGPKLWGFKRGETEYVISWLPLGGYVRMAGMEDLEMIEGGPETGADEGVLGGPGADEDAAAVSEARRTGRDFESKSLPARALVISAGVIMNMAFAWAVFVFIALVWGVARAPEAVVGDVLEERVPVGAQALLDVPEGARITAIGGAPVEDWEDVGRRIFTAAPGPLTLQLSGGQAVTVQVPRQDSLRAALAASLEPAVQLDPLIGLVADDSPAQAAGIEVGDEIVRVDGRDVTGWQQFVSAIESRPGEAVSVTVRRDGELVTLTLTPEAQPVPAATDGRQVGRIGVGSTRTINAAFPRDRKGPLAAVAYGTEQTVNITALILDFLRGLFTGEASPRDVGGPVLIFQLSGQVVQIGPEAFLTFMALFSINLAILNLLPIPILDGGQLMFLAIEAVRGRALSIEQRIRLSQVGMVIVIGIMVWALANDILRLFGI